MKKIIISLITIPLLILSLGTFADTIVTTPTGPVILAPGPDNVYVPATGVTTTTGTYGSYYYFTVPYQGTTVDANCYLVQPSNINADLLGTFNVNVGGSAAQYYCYRP